MSLFNSTSERGADYSHPNVEQAPSHYPRNMRLVWEHGQDLAQWNKMLWGVIIVMGIAMLTIGGTLYRQVQKPPLMVMQVSDDFIVWPKVETMRLREGMIMRFIRMAGEPALQYSPGYYDVASIQPFYDPSVLKIMKDTYGAKASKQSFGGGERGDWRVHEVRRYYDAKLPQWIVFAARGPQTIIRSSNGIPDIENRDIVVMFYCQRVVPFPDNPLGLVIRGVQVYDDDEKEKYWKLSQPVVGTDDGKGKEILEDRRKD